MALGVFLFGALVKGNDIVDPTPIRIALGQAIQFLSAIFSVLCVFAAIMAWIRGPLPDPDVPTTEQIPVRPLMVPAPPPAPPKNKYTERDFMPPGMRNELETSSKGGNEDEKAIQKQG